MVCGGELFQIKGLNPKKRKYCIEVARVSDGKSFGLTLQATKDGLARLTH